MMKQKRAHSLNFDQRITEHLKKDLIGCVTPLLAAGESSRNFGKSLSRNSVDSRRHVCHSWRGAGSCTIAKIFWPCQPKLITRFSRCATMPPPPSRGFDFRFGEQPVLLYRECPQKSCPRFGELAPAIRRMGSRNLAQPFWPTLLIQFPPSPLASPSHAKCNYQRRRGW